MKYRASVRIGLLPVPQRAPQSRKSKREMGISALLMPITCFLSSLIYGSRIANVLGSGSGAKHNRLTDMPFAGSHGHGHSF